MLQMIKLQLTLHMLFKNARLVSSVQLLPQIRAELKNSIWSKCGDHQTELLEIFWMVLFLESQLLFLTFQDLSQDGPSQLLLVDTLMLINIDAKMLSLMDQERLSLYTLQITEMHQLIKKFINSKEEGVILVCSIPKHLLKDSLEHACNMLLEEDILWNFHQRIQFWKSMMAFSSILLKEFIKKNSSVNSKKLELIMNIDLLMIWLLKLSRVKEELYGHAKITMVMFNLILLLKVLDHLD